MIFVTTGTAGFDDLVKKVDEIAPKLQDEIIVTIGYGKYKPKNCKWMKFTDKFEDHIKKSSLIITHGGAGSVFACLKAKKKILAVPNPKHIDDQSEIINKLSGDGYLLGCKDFSDLEMYIKKTKLYKFKKYNSPKCEIKERIVEFIEEIK